MISPSQLAKMTNIHPNSVRNWSREFGEFFTPEARGDVGKRSYMEADVEAMRVIAALKKSGASNEEIRQRLRDHDAPSVVDVPPSPPTLNLHEPTPNSGASHEVTLALHAIQSNLQAQIDALRADVETRDQKRVNIWATAFILGVFCTLVIVALVLAMP